MPKKFEVNRTKIKGGCQSYTKAQRWTEGRSLRPKAEGFTPTATATVAEGLGP